MRPTNKVYGGLDHIPTVELESRYAFRDLPEGISEGEPTDFHSPYGCSKGRPISMCATMPASMAYRRSCFASRASTALDRWASRTRDVVAWFVIAAVTGRPITIYGDGKQVRDLLYIDDLLDAFDAAARNIEVAGGQVYNMGGGAGNAISIWQEFKPCSRTHSTNPPRPGVCTGAARRSAGVHSGHAEMPARAGLGPRVSCPKVSSAWRIGFAIIRRSSNSSRNARPPVGYLLSSPC